MKVHVLVGSHKGAFIFTSDERRREWQQSDLLFPGYAVHHLIADPRSGNLYGALDHLVYGPHLQRSEDFGRNWQVIDPPQEIAPDGPTYKRIWHVKPGHADSPGTIWAGADPGALYRSDDHGDTWQPVLSVNQHGTRDKWFPGAGGMMVHSIVHDHSNPNRIYIGVSAAGCFRSDDGGETWQPKNRNVLADFLPEGSQYPEVGQCVHHLVQSSEPNLLYQQNHCGVYRSEDNGDTWIDCNDQLPARFGFVIDVLPHKPKTIFTIPQISPEYRYVPEGKLRVYRSQDGGDTFEPMANGLPQDKAYLTVKRQAMAVDSCATGGVYFGTSNGHVYYSRDEGDSWEILNATLPPVYSVECFVEE